MRQAWQNIANAYNDPLWEPLNPVIHPVDVDDDELPVPVYNCSLARFIRLRNVDPHSLTCRIATGAFCQSLYKDIKTELSIAAEKNGRSGPVCYCLLVNCFVFPLTFIFSSIVVYPPPQDIIKVHGRLRTGPMNGPHFVAIPYGWNSDVFWGLAYFT